MGEQLSILRLIVQASVPVQIVIGILLLASLGLVGDHLPQAAHHRPRAPRGRSFREPLLVGR